MHEKVPKWVSRNQHLEKHLKLCLEVNKNCEDTFCVAVFCYSKHWRDIHDYGNGDVSEFEKETLVILYYIILLFCFLISLIVLSFS